MILPDKKSPIKFIADGMLGRLSKWLRLFGYDTVFFKGNTDKELVFESLRQHRIILTRDTGITQKKPVNLVLLKSEKLGEQISQLKKVLKLELTPGDFYSRCLVCNSPLSKSDKEKAKNKVPPYVYRTHRKFSYCSKCRKYYWRGSHLKLARKIINKILAGQPPNRTESSYKII